MFVSVLGGQPQARRSEAESSLSSSVRKREHSTVQVHLEEVECLFLYWADSPKREEAKRNRA